MKPYWKDYPELNKCYRTKYEDKLSEDLLNLMVKIYRYLKKSQIKKYLEDMELVGDLQGSVHLIQGIFITIQKRRYNLKNE